MLPRRLNHLEARLRKPTLLPPISNAAAEAVAFLLLWPFEGRLALARGGEREIGARVACGPSASGRGDKNALVKRWRPGSTPARRGSARIDMGRRCLLLSAP